MTEPETPPQADIQNGAPVQVRATAVHKPRGKPEPAERPATPPPSEEADAASDPGGIAANYRYWREHGGEWVAEYNTRKKTQICYHIQEIMLTQYIAAHAPASVLEFGCGVGRHLRNLVQIPGVDPYGFDQSATMASGCATWAADAWIRDHITVGAPTGRLPYEDGQFDIVYSCEVLVHVRPGDLEGVLRELLRVSRRQVFHLEPAEHIVISDGDHDGCWKHDLVAAYERIGLRCELLPSGYPEHAPYRVWKPGCEPPVAEQWRWSPLTLSLYRRLASDIMAGLTASRTEAEALRAKTGELERVTNHLREQFQAASQRAEQLAAQLNEAQAERQRLAAALEAAQQQAEHSQARIDELAAGLRTEQQTWKERTEDLMRRVAFERERAQSLQEAYQRLKDAVTETAHVR